MIWQSYRKQSPHNQNWALVLKENRTYRRQSKNLLKTTNVQKFLMLRELLMIDRRSGFLAVMLWLLPHPSPISKLDRWQQEDWQHALERGVRGLGRSQILYDSEMAWSSINSSILSDHKMCLYSGNFFNTPPTLVMCNVHTFGKQHKEIDAESD
jgi:hypothetical protein